MSHRAPLRRRILAPVVLLVLAGLTACSGGGSDGATAGGGGTDGRPAPASAEAGVDAALVEDAADGPDAPDPLAPKLISTGTVSLRAPDVDDARFEVQKVVDRVGGQITDSETRTDDDGATSTARLVLRVPSEAFTETVDELEGLGELETSTTKSEDVTTQVIDTRVRIRVQRASIARIQALLDRAQDIRAVIDIEEQLSRRQATLNSLLRQQAYLADQTSLSTITVHLERTDADRPSDEEEATGFFAGLHAGWDALKGAGTVVATVAGALLPWLLVAALLSPLAWALLRIGRRRRTAAPVASEG